MKKLVILLVSLVSIGKLHAASTDTVKLLEKVVEIHMSSKMVQVQESKRKKANLVPLPGQGTCSGAFVNSMGDIITAKHCVTGYDSFEVLTFDQRTYTAVVIATSSVHDLALIHIDRTNTAHFDPAQSVVQGEEISILGSPLGFTNTLTTGIVAKVRGDDILVDCGVLPGNSGGPVFNRDGNLVGIAVSGYIVFMGMTHLNVAEGPDAVYFFVMETLRKRYGQ